MARLRGAYNDAMTPFFKADPLSAISLRARRGMTGVCVVAGILGWGVPGPVRAADEERPLPEFKFSAPYASLAAAARTAEIPITGFDPLDGGAGMRDGDAVTALACLTDGEKVRQWLVHLRATLPDEAEAPRLRDRTLQLFTNLGSEIEFSGRSVVVAIRILGPARGVGAEDRTREGGVKDETDRVLVNSEFLRLGFARACVSLLRIRAVESALGGPDAFVFEVGRSAFAPEVVAVNRGLRQRLGVTLEEERAMAGIGPARTEFFRIARNAPGMDDAIRHVVDVPWWSIIFSGGRVRVSFENLPGIDSVKAEPWNLSFPARVFALPAILEINGKPAMTFRLAAVDSHPPLQTCAGIVGVAAQRPDGKGPHFMIRVLAARRGTGELLVPPDSAAASTDSSSTP